MNRKHIAPTDTVEVRLSVSDKELILTETFMEPELMEGLVPVSGKSDQLTCQFTLDDIEDMLGHIAAAANHAPSKKLERELDAIYGQLDALQRSYDDGNWNDSGQAS